MNKEIWFNHIPPRDWELTRLKNVVISVKNGIWGDEPANNSDDIECVRIADFDRKKNTVQNKELTVRNIPSSQAVNYLLKKGDLLIEKSGGGEKQPVGFVVQYNLERKAVYANFMAKIELDNQKVDSTFINYVFTTLYAVKANLKAFNQTTGIQNLNTSMYLNEVFVYPSLELQKKIVEFLSVKTDAIDNLIESKQKMINKLEQQRQSIITESITKGLNPNVKMKDSGVEWIGEIPENWELSKIKFQTNINTDTLTDNTDLSFELKYIDIGSVNSKGEIINLELMKFEDAPSRARRIVKKDDVIVSTVRTYLKAIATIESDEPNLICSTGFAVLTAKSSINTRYLSHLFKSTKYIDEIVSRSTGVSYPAINASEIGQLECLLPPKEEQDKIAKFIDRKIFDIDSVDKLVKKQIEKLKEYRQSLIYEAVTGKIDLRDMELD